jgi:hypothetical protein
MDAAWLDFIRDSQSSGEGLVEQRFLQRRQSGVLGGRWGDPIHEEISRGDSYPQKYFKGLQGQDLSESHAMIELGGRVWKTEMGGCSSLLGLGEARWRGNIPETTPASSRTPFALR